LEAFEQAATSGSWKVGSSVRFRPATSGKLDWPIVGASYVLLKTEQKSRQRARRMLEFFHWALTEGAPLARELGYATIPKEHVERIEELWRARIKAEGRAVW
jgi:phosphate transport system substrate-binding protein